MPRATAKKKEAPRYSLVGGACFVAAFSCFAGNSLARTRVDASPLPVQAIATPALVAPAPKALGNVSVEPIRYGAPVKLSIEKLGISADIQSMGLTKDGNMDVPKNIVDVGWYDSGADPGNVGTAVIAGHLDGAHNERGVFADLKKLAPDDIVTVTDENGETSRFVVRRSHSYPQDARPQEVFSVPSGAHLNLITCTGTWDTDIDRYSQRLVVFADKIEEE